MFNPASLSTFDLSLNAALPRLSLGSSLFLIIFCLIIPLKRPLHLTPQITSQSLLPRYGLLCLDSESLPLLVRSVISPYFPASVGQASPPTAALQCASRPSRHRAQHESQSTFSAFSTPCCVPHPLLSTRTPHLHSNPTFYNLNFNYTSDIIYIAFKNEIL